MRVVFMGTPRLAATILEEVALKHDVVAVFTRPDAVRGRGNVAVPSSVKEAALRIGVPVYERSSMKDDESIELLRSIAPDAICVAAFGIILPREMLELPRYGCLNVHTSLLPRWRGAAPIERSILAGDDTTGVCIMRMEEGLDSGDYCRRIEIPMREMYVDELTAELARVGASELLAALDDVEHGSVSWTQQGENGLVYAEKIAKGELALDPVDSALNNIDRVRASSAAHPARAEIAGRTLAVERACSVADDFAQDLVSGMEQGDAKFMAKRLFLRASDGAFEVLQVRPDGKKSMDARSFAGGIQGIKKMKLTWGRA